MYCKRFALQTAVSELVIVLPYVLFSLINSSLRQGDIACMRERFVSRRLGVKNSCFVLCVWSYPDLVR